MAWVENDKIISEAESRELTSKGFQYVQGVLKSHDEVNDLIRAGYTTPHLANRLQYTFTAKEAKDLRILGVGVLGVGLVSVGALKIGKIAKSKFYNRRKGNF